MDSGKVRRAIVIHGHRYLCPNGLSDTQGKRKKLKRPQLSMEVPVKVNERCSMDFASGQLSIAKRFGVFNIVDDFGEK